MNALVMFAKAPDAGRVKTRLCPPLSHSQAAAAYRAFALDTLEALKHVTGTRLLIAYDAGASKDGPGWLDSGAEWFPQAGDGLGERLVNAFGRAFGEGAARVVIVGSDMPDLEPRQVERAFERLERQDVVLGPAVDGGYYLVGLNRLRAALFEAIPWSTSKVLADTLERIKTLRLSVELLEPYQDVDTASDLAALGARLRGAFIAPFTRRVLSEIRQEAHRS